jgi:hypothetical protein
MNCDTSDNVLWDLHNWCYCFITTNMQITCCGKTQTSPWIHSIGLIIFYLGKFIKCMGEQTSNSPKNLKKIKLLIDISMPLNKM